MGTLIQTLIGTPNTGLRSSDRTTFAPVLQAAPGPQVMTQCIGRYYRTNATIKWPIRRTGVSEAQQAIGKRPIGKQAIGRNGVF